MFTKSLTNVLQTCLSVISFSIFIDILISKLNIYLNRKITKFQNGTIESAIYQPLIQRFGKYISLIDTVLNILVANLIGLLSPQYLDPVFWISLVILIIDILILLPRYKELVSKIKYIKSQSKNRHKKLD